MLKVNNSKGLTMLISMVVLLCILFLCLTTMNQSIFTRSVVSTVQSEQQAQRAAAAAVIEAEKYLLANQPGASEFSDDCTNGLCTYDSSQNIQDNESAWQNANQTTTDFKTDANLQEQPKYLIEYMGEREYKESITVGTEYGGNQDNTTTPIYRITGKAKGKDGQEEEVIQSTIY